MLKVFALIFSLSLLTSCASLEKSRWQDLTIVTTDDKSVDTLCAVTNEEGIWRSIAPRTKVNIHRDGNLMSVVCENNNQQGMSEIDANFMTNFLVADLLFDLCTISCLVDAGYNSFYEYPSQVVVKMKEKKP